jgi:peptidoglycan hydrolase-like protein with peptidoglycan-binding domain
MRAREFLSNLFESNSKVFVVGDSIAVGIKTAGKAQGSAKGGDSADKVLAKLNAFLKSTDVKGAVIILSSGASNSAKTILEDGTVLQQTNLSAVDAQLKAIKAAGATAVLVGTGSEKSIFFPATPFSKGQKYQVDLTGINQQLASIAATNGVKFLGPLEKFDSGLHSGKGDGIHPYGGYSKLFQAGASVAPAVGAEEKPDATKEAFAVDVPQGKRGPDIADAQKALVALGIPLPKYGVDGIQGKETTGAIKKFQQTAGIPDSGALDQSTVDKLNAQLKTKPEVLATLTKSTNADVKSLDYSRGAEEVAALTSDDSTQKARASAEKFLGRQMSDQEWNYLLRATTAEASNNSKEQAYVMGVILNRTRSGNWGDNVISVLRAPSQFQAVTGTRYDPGPSTNFSNGPNNRQLANIVDGAINILPGVSSNLKYFTAASAAAYGPGTNIGFRDRLIAQGGEKIGGTIFSATA